MPADQFVGRAAELAALDRALAELDHGRPSTLEIVGEPGIGKTRLLAELSARADARGHIVLGGSASEFEYDLPFWLFVDALDEYVKGVDPRRLSGLDPNELRELSHVLPSQPAGPAAPAGPVQDQRYRAQQAVRRLLEELAASKPLVLVLDDVHWADSGSVELLGALLRRPPRGPVLVALAVRPHQAPDRLSSALERAARTGALHRLELSALTIEQAGQFLGPATDRRAVAALHAASGGNPFYLQQLARSLPRTRGFEVAVLADIPVPPAVAAALLEELHLLDDADRRVLDGAAVAGDPFDLDLAAAAAGTSESATLEALDELLRRDLIRHTEVPRRFRFRHPLVRRAVYGSAPGGWRLAAHERAAAALAAQGASPALRAHHVEQAAHAGDLGAVAVLRQAGDALLPRAPASAARWFAAALRLLPDSASPADRTALGIGLAWGLAATGRFAEAHAAILDSLAAVADDAPAVRVRLLADCAGLEQMPGLHETAHARLMGGLKQLPDPGSPVAVGLMLELAADYLYRMEYRSMRDWSQRALEAARPLGDRLLTARAAARLAFSGILAGSVAAASAASAEAAALIDGLSDEELAQCLERAAAPLAAAELYLDRYADADRRAERVLRVARATGRDHLATVLYWIGAIRLARGMLPDAAEVLDTAVEISRLSGNPTAATWSLSGRAFVAAAAGDIDTALAAAQDGVDVVDSRGETLTSVWAAYALATALLPAGDPARAAAVLVHATGGDDLPLLPAIPRVGACELLTNCLLALGRRDRAGQAASTAESCANALGLPGVRAIADRAAAAVALDAGDADNAARLALRSATAADAIGAVIEAATSRVLAGRALAETGDREQAAAQLQSAATVFDACAAPRRRDAAEHALRRIGYPGTHRRSGPAADGRGTLRSLTGRELQVARLVVDRRTNSEIAAALFLSQKTVETHLRNLFHKLGVSSRAEVARAVERADRDGRSP
jgi:DNA-binding NarL/FixJ family response regulator